MLISTKWCRMINWVRYRVVLPSREANYSPPVRGEVKNEHSYTSITLCALIMWTGNALRGTTALPDGFEVKTNKET